MVVSFTFRHKKRTPNIDRQVLGAQKNINLIITKYGGESQMAKYHVNPVALEDIDCSVLIDAVARYLNTTEYPEIRTVTAILGIEKVEEE
jgi:hypothetical protein